MYSPEIVSRRLHQLKKAGIEVQRFPRERSIEIAGKLEALRRDPRGNLLPDNALSRPLDDREKAFISSERALCKADFTYWAVRYACMELDPGVGHGAGIGPAPFLESQERFVTLVGRREEVCFAELAKHNFTAGILVYDHKTRQVGHTEISRMLTIHRMIFWPAQRAFAAALRDDETGTGELYRRDKIILDNLPFWMKVDPYPDVKNSELGFPAPLSSHITYQAENQQTGIGTGTQQDVSHLTEVSLWSYPHRIRYSFVPSIPKAVSTLHIQEATSAGKGGYWQEVTEAARWKRPGFEDFIYVFIPWWMNVSKYRANPPDDWRPDEHTVKHAEMIERTSPEFNDGVTAHPTRAQLYWWQTTRAMHAQNNETAFFLANYPATPEQSFVNWAQGALPVELIEEMELDVRPPRAYEIQVERQEEPVSAEGHGIDSDGFARTWYVGNSVIRAYEEESAEEIARDPRGLLLLWEPPRPNCRYVLSGDSAEGIVGWNRGARRDNDSKTDNSALLVFRPNGAKELLWKEVDGRKIPDIDPDTKKQRVRWKDVQVAEWAGPCDPVEAARIAYILGQLYRGTDEDQCKLIWESWPGCGMLMTQELIRLGYANLFVWQFITEIAQDTNRLGWLSTRDSVKILWQRSRRHLMLKQVVIRSQWLLAEYTNAEIDMERMRAKAASGFHDDRFVSANLNFWAGHEWTHKIESEHEEVRTAPAPKDMQSYAPVLGEDNPSFRAWKEDAVASWLDDD